MIPHVRGIFIAAVRCTAVSSEAWAKLGDWASVAGWGRLIFSGSVAHASLKTAVLHDTYPVPNLKGFPILIIMEK